MWCNSGNDGDARSGLENNNEVYIHYVDTEKAFDRINWAKLTAASAATAVDCKGKNSRNCTLTKRLL